jgi:hypothetical protein
MKKSAVRLGPGSGASYGTLPSALWYRKAVSVNRKYRMSTEVPWTDVPGPTAYGMAKNELRTDKNPTTYINGCAIL